jgi:hypothetical protein
VVARERTHAVTPCARGRRGRCAQLFLMVTSS